MTVILTIDRPIGGLFACSETLLARLWTVETFAITKFTVANHSPVM